MLIDFVLINFVSFCCFSSGFLNDGFFGSSVFYVILKHDIGFYYEFHI